MNQKSLFLVIVILSGLLLVLLHGPFLHADPDYHVSGSRGANTDEGLNSFQIRNYVNHHDLTFRKSDNFVKTPLFGAFLFVPFRIFGTKWVIGRLTILLSSIILCFFVFGHNRYYASLGIISILVVFLEYYIFHFTHYCLPEVLSTALIFISIFICTETGESTSVLRSSLLAATFISAAYYMKIQFLYAVVILPMILVLLILISKQSSVVLMKQLKYTLMFLAAYLALYLLLWYLPNREFFDYVMKDQTAGRFVAWSELRDHLDFIFDTVFYNNYLKLFTYSFYALFGAGIILFFTLKRQRFHYLFMGFSCWLLIESHKLSMTYLPTRYLISLFFPMGLLISLVLWELIRMEGRGRIKYVIRLGSMLVLLLLGVINVKHYAESLRGRTAKIRETNQYLAQYEFDDRPILGSWAPSLSWDCKAITFPVWNNYFNDQDVLENYHPAIIVSEPGEEESNQAFLSRGMDIDSCADSIRTLTINRWDLKILWIKAEEEW
ncbi:MAG: hypothetical protein V2B15_18060 [Bacteroidota bacterium]